MLRNAASYPGRRARGHRADLEPRRGLSAVEVLLGIGLLAALFIPVYGLFVSGQEMGFKSRLAYLALQAAREEIADLKIRAALLEPSIAKMGHPWREVSGRLLARLEPLARPGELPEIVYPKEYARIYTRLDIGLSADNRVFPATLVVRWQEHGESLGESDFHEREGTSRFDFLLTPGGGVGGR